MTLDYPDPKRRSRLRTTGKIITLSGVLIAVVAFFRGGLLTSADIRLDCGDLRYRVLGVPLIYSRMPEPQRSQLLALAAHSKTLRSEWEQCATYPLPTTNNTDGMCQQWYYNASAWIVEDPTLARVMLEDVADYIRSTKVREGLPDSASLLSGEFVTRNANRVWVVKSDWRETEDVRAYMASKGYVPPTTKP